ncbi:PTS sugar transporter subunit IIA [uncultured Limosilactobacillus sp.]|uniref:PTS sugar transporter subunit IIA n=1 Tax=uncultured Limosilactobacillus sp. TaxID=2837629 RepID=UPI0025E33479|nr:PTS sugar transporter subunit IIA [uncultured Limosilactobacillus sp.]
MKIHVSWEQYETDEQEVLLFQLADSLQKARVIVNKKSFVYEVIKREQMASTIIASNLAIPHIRSIDVLQPRIEVVKLSAPLKDWEGHQGINRLVFALVPLKMSANDQRECMQFFVNLGKCEVLNLFSRGSQKDLKDYLRGRGDSNNGSNGC